MGIAFLLMMWEDNYMNTPHITAATIFNQLGAGRFAAMTGAKNFVADANRLAFKLPARFAQKSITYVTITLDADDTYTVAFFNLRGLNLKAVSSFSGVYAEDLRSLFTSETGLHTSLGTMGR